MPCMVPRSEIESRGIFMYVKAIVSQLNVKYVGDCALLRLLLNYVANQFHQLISSQLMVFQDWLFVDLLTFTC